MTDRCLLVLQLVCAVSFVLLASTSCRSSNPYAVNEGELAQRYLPSARHVDYPPDSLKGLTLRETDERIHFDLETTYEQLLLRWSTSYRVTTGRQPTRPLTYATFWSLEVSLASLQPELGVGSLSKDKADELIAQRRKEYAETIQIDVYWFGPPSQSAVAAPGVHARLRDASGRSYQPMQKDYGPVREAFIGGTGTTSYRRNTFVFARTVDDTDLLANTDELSLQLSPAGMGTTFRFQWTWDRPSL